MSALEVVNSFIAAVERGDIDAAGALLAEDVVYHNVPMDPIVGREATVGFLSGFLASATEGVEWIVNREVESGGTVVNERVDRFGFAAGWLDLPVCGVWEVSEADQITLWRDYFDLNTYMTRLAELSS